MANKKAKKSKKAHPPTDDTSSVASEQKDRDREEDLDDDAAASDEEQTAEAPKEPEEPKKPKKASKDPREGKSAGIVAVFDHPNVTLEAAKKARDRGFQKWDVHTPFPVHGMDDAMGLGPSPVPWITFVMGVAGFCTAVIIQFGTMVYSWPMNYGGKPFAAWPSFVPITFEMTVLFAGVSTAIGSLVLGGVFKLRKRIAHRQVTSHRFAIFVEASDPKYDEVETLSLFKESGALEVRVVKEGE
jgi:hypothetical protein